MSTTCRAAREGFSDYAAERLPAAQRDFLRGHLRDCAGCRGEAARFDPTLLFGTLPAPETSDREVASVLEGVRAAIAWKQAERRLAPPRRRSARWVSAAAVALLTLALPAGLRVARSPAASQPPVAAEEIARDPDFALAASAEEGGEGAADATIYDWNPGDGQPRVIWIVDRSLDI